MPFKGTRHTAVAYKARNWKRIDLSLRTSLERLGVPVPRALPTPVRSVCTQSLPLRSIVIDLVINAILRGPDTNTSLSRLGTGQLNSPKFGIGRSIPFGLKFLTLSTILKLGSQKKRHFFTGLVW